MDSDVDSKSTAAQNQYDSTDSIHIDLKRRSLQSSLVTVTFQPLKFALGFGSTSILARLLTPTDFGLLAMVAPLLALVDSLTNLGLETATIQWDKLDREQASAMFWFSLKPNALIIGFMLLMAPVLAWFYREAELVEITLVMAIGVSSLCLTFQHRSLLKRQMRFGTITAIEIIALTVGVVFAVGAAWLGFRYWALVFQLVAMQVTQSFASWLVCGWQPTTYTKTAKLDADLRSMLSYGAHLTGFRFLTRIGNQLDRILIGYFGGAQALGLYYIAYKWAYFPFEQIYYPLFDVTVTSLSRAYRDPDLYRAYCRRGLALLFTLCLPALAFSFVEARNLLLVLLGEQWLEAVPLFQLLIASVSVTSMYRVTKWLYVSAGQTQRQFRWGLVYTTVTVVGVTMGARWGAYGVAVGYTIATFLLTYPAIAYCLKTLPLSLREFLGTVWRPAVSAMMAASILAISRLILPSFTNLVLDLLVRVILFGIAYLLLWIVLPGGRQASTDVWQSFKALRSNRNSSIGT